MSLNLNARSKGTLLNLWQTPTNITLALVCDYKGETHELHGKSAKRAMYGYLYWAQYLCNGVFDNAEDAEDRRNSYNEHVAYLTPYIESDDLEVWIM